MGDSSSSTTSSEETTGTLLICGGTDWPVLGRTQSSKLVALGSRDLPQFHIIGALKDKKVRLVTTGPISCHNLVVTEDESVYVFGRNDCGQLGLGDLDARLGPTRLTLPDGVTVAKAATGRNHTVIISNLGKVYAMGDNRYGQCGHPSLKNLSIPTHVSALNVTVVDVACGGDFTVCLSDKGKLFSFGHPEYGQLGNGTDGKTLQANRVYYDPYPVPKVISALEDVQIKSLSCGTNHTLALDANGHIWSWGAGGYGRLGHGDQKDQSRPKMIVAPRPWSQMRAGATFCMANDQYGNYHMWGKFKVSGEGSSGSPWTHPKMLGDLAGFKVRCFSGGGSQIAVIADDTTVTWGQACHNYEHGAGEGRPKSQSKPDRLGYLEGVKAIRVDCGAMHTLLLVAPGEKVLSLPEWDTGSSEPEPKTTAKGRKRKADESTGVTAGNDDVKPRGRGIKATKRK
ncbi:RCC1/BLIP-II protein [Gonapodya prolifera JEL478]|uniref:RCC1/BLIP-II protein n=1 Tax=Gonapodya prolifera (strain JEL478) TaxID=1344416 RepID=A0A139A5F7_GONPJ|nr:RCC1/BLIP-II protein [Gonapodya prolifera JEL478]|eukprot:KXS11869.1 RCC1/BLIP-II protein [Gonapodya prolifera JEL478]